MKKAVNKLIPLTMALSLGAGAALAADLPSYKAPPAPLPPPPPLWTGFYVGLNAGYTFSAGNTLNVGTAPLLPGAGIAAWAASGNARLANQTDGFIGGGQIGYNWQFGPSIVIGGEADIQGVAATGNNGASATAVQSPFPGVTFLTSYDVSNRMDYLGTVRGRVGWLFTPTLLLYGTGGLAYAGVQSSVNLFQFTNTGASFGLGGASFADTRVGWTAGGGVEWMFMPSWSAKVEYLYYDLGSASNAFALVRTPPAAGAYAVTQANARFSGHIVRAGVNYHFNWGSAPIIAKY